jgi:hypothetical protein
VSVQLHALVALPPGKELLVSIGYEARSAPKPVWTGWRRFDIHFILLLRFGNKIYR